jgi:hypothetical protein
MAYGRVCLAGENFNANDADVSHLAERVRGYFSLSTQGPLIRPFGPPSPQGEKGRWGAVADRQVMIGAAASFSNKPPMLVSLSPRGRGREAMAYGRVHFVCNASNGNGAVVSHLAELVRGYFSMSTQGPLIRPFGPPSPQGENGHSRSLGVS